MPDIPDLPPGVRFREFGVPRPEDYIWDRGELVQFAHREKPAVIVEPDTGYAFGYDIRTDKYLIVKTG